MARLADRRAENVPGDFFVDSTCIDCDACRWLAPATFAESGGQSAVHRQPASPAERFRALQALVACPTGSIGAAAKSPDLSRAVESFPELLEDDVYYCGFHSERSYGAASYFIRRPEGNLLIDSPRLAAPLAKRLDALGGVRRMYLTHRDDVADHAQFRARFGCDRVIHRREATGGLADVEIAPEGEEPIAMEGGDLLWIPVPGHTEGHVALLYREKFLFTGDHLAFSPELGHLYAFKDYCWHDWSQLVESTRRLARYPFERVLPGHGRPWHGAREEARRQMDLCLAWMARA